MTELELKEILDKVRELHAWAKPGVGTSYGGIFPPSHTPPPTAPPKKPFLYSRDSFWARQPKQVQALRAIQDQSMRLAEAKNLASQGFAIERRLHVNDFDPAPTIRKWQAEGYGSWIPGILIADKYLHPLHPGFPGMLKYDASNPPATGAFPLDLSFVEDAELE